MKINDKVLADTIRILSMDAVQNANSGHPGMPMGMADVATVLFKYFLKFNPNNPKWLNRDRFVLSAGHGSMLLYSLLFLTGYKSIKLIDIKNFRKLNSICAGHPEFHPNTGIETTTGPLGQGVSNAVGFAMAEEILKSKIGKSLINHKTYVLAGDGCLMEGISHEALSLAGHLKLKNLVMLFDNNSISIDGPTNLAVSDNYKKRFESYGWDFIPINGHNHKEIYNALKKVQKAKKPTVISCKTKIGFGSPNKEGKESSHGSPLGEEEIKLVRKNLNWNFKPFDIPKNIINEWKNIGKKGEKLNNDWNKKYLKNKKIFSSVFKNNISILLKKEKIKALKETKSLATRKSSEFVLNQIVKDNQFIIGGSADLSGSNNTKTKNHKIINSKDYSGNYIHYGVREHAMCGIMNGIALHSKLIPYGGTFLIFSDYCKPSIRLSSLMKQNVIFIMSHDSIGLGEDGPTHQPIEQLTGLRAIPNLNVLRPADRIETIECWEIALKSKNTPSVIALTRQNLDPIRTHYSSKNKCEYGAYEVMRTSKKIGLTLLASGSEVNIAIDVAKKLKKEKIYSKVISFPSQEIFEKQSKKYKEKILNETRNKISIEAGSIDSWIKYVESKDFSFGINEFGKSAPYKDLYKSFGLTAEKIIAKIKKILN